MPIYLFQSDNGSEVDKYFSYDDAPRIGDVIQIDGMTCTRVASFLLDGAGISRKVNQYPYVSNRLPPTIHGCKMVSDNKTGRLKPMITSQRHEREVMAMNNLQRDGEGV